MRCALLTVALLFLSMTSADAKNRVFSYSVQETQGVSLEIVDRATVRLTVARPTYQIPTLEIKLTEPIAMDRPDGYRFTGSAHYSEGTLNLRGRWFTNGTVDEQDDRMFVVWIYVPDSVYENGDPCEADDETLELP